jgi:hypothetical protein
MSVDVHSLHFAVRLRRLLARRPWIRWLAIVVCAGAAGVGLQGKVAALDEAKAQWDGGTLVFVLRHDVAAGDQIRPSDVAERFVAPDIVPGGAAASFDQTVIARHAMGRGEIITGTHVGRAGGPAGLLRPGSVGVAVALPVGSSVPLAVGDRVGVVIGLDPLGLSTAQVTTGVVAEGEIVDVSSESAVVGIESSTAAQVATAAAGGRVTLILLGTPAQAVRSSG